ncbi:MAG: BTAD domain-containing putative transcriptional regulator [Candidatus Brachytrichaceae bacterium NZ_4S206]
MPFTSAQAAALCADEAGVRQPGIERAAGGGTTFIIAPPGYLYAGGLAHLFLETRRTVLWLRLGREHKDPGALLMALLAGAERLWPGISAPILKRMRQRPGAIYGWADLFIALGQQIAQVSSSPLAVVMEHAHLLNRAASPLALLGKSFLPNLPPGTAVAITSYEPLCTTSWTAHAVTVGVDDLRMDAEAVRAALQRAGMTPPSSLSQHLVRITQGCAEIIASVCAAARELGATPVTEIVSRSGDANSLLTRLARAYLNEMASDAQRATVLALHLDYFDAALLDQALGQHGTIVGPWLQRLSNGWMCVKDVWRATLQTTLGRWGKPSRAALNAAADYLAARGELQRAVPLYLSTGNIGCAARHIASIAGALLDYGLWQTLDEWLSLLPPVILHQWPWLVYVRGEIAAAQGDLKTAHQAFTVASRLFSTHHDAEGACQSLMAESVVLNWLGNPAHAQTQALTASAIAENAGLDWHRGWAMWQLGHLAALHDDLDNALAYFERVGAVAAFTSNESIAEIVRRVESLTLKQRNARIQREFHRRAYFVAEATEQAAAEQLRALLSEPVAGCDALLSAHGWSHTPLILKLAAPSPMLEAPASPERPGLWGTLRGLFGIQRRPMVGSRTGSTTSAPPIPSVPTGAIVTNTGSVILDQVPSTAPFETRTATIIEPVAEAAPAGPNPPADPPEGITLTVHLLGQFHARFNDQPIEQWPPGRGRTLFKYLIMNHRQPQPRDVLMEMFWPDAAPEAARNSLNVALHGLRQAFRAVTDETILEHSAGSYRFNPRLKIWVDVEEFERHAKLGIQFEAAGKLAEAASEYEVANGLYQGDFLASEPYEEWTILPRERLRLSFLDVLDRLGRLYFSQARYASCISLCQRILTLDNCREDIHCRLMRCYSRQNQHYLALRQFEICASTLRTELNINPSASTSQLVERIRRREKV